jgi:CheY-like chemotaxis protein
MPFSKKILFAEDDPNDIELTMMALEEYNLANEVVSVKNGVEALDYLYQRGRFENRPEGHPLLVLLDNKMPKKSGLDVLREIKSDPDLKKIPVVMLTSSKEDRDILDSYDLGVNAYVVKPVIFHDFIKAVKSLGLFWLLTNEPPR